MSTKAEIVKSVMQPLVAELLALVKGKCPKCSAEDLHSASLDGVAAISCCECDYAVTYESLQERAFFTDHATCLSRARDDEPVFILRAHDPVAPEIVREWSDAYASRKEEAHEVMTTEERAKYKEARTLADQMEEWQKLNGVQPWS